MKRKNGFTLVEVILTIVVLAIVATAIISYFDKSLTGSFTRIKMVQSQYALMQRMEEITISYRNYLNLGMTAGNWTAFQTYCSARCTCVSTQSIGAYTTLNTHLQVTCRDGDQSLFAVFTQ